MAKDEDLAYRLMSQRTPTAWTCFKQQHPVRPFSVRRAAGTLPARPPPTMM
jgi:hypothetical protein